MRDVTPQYERIANPLGGNGEESQNDWPSQEARQEPASVSEAGTDGNQPQDQKASPEPPGEAGNGKKRQTRKKDAETSAAMQAGWSLALPQPWNRTGSASYVGYALIWMAAAPSQERARERWNTERAIR